MVSQKITRYDRDEFFLIFDELTVKHAMVASTTNFKAATNRHVSKPLRRPIVVPYYIRARHTKRQPPRYYCTTQCTST